MLSKIWLLWFNKCMTINLMVVFLLLGENRHNCGRNGYCSSSFARIFTRLHLGGVLSASPGLILPSRVVYNPRTVYTVAINKGG